MKKIVCFLILNIAACKSLFAQNSPILRTSVGAEKKFTKKLSFETKLETRYFTPVYTDAMIFNFFRLFELGANYKLNKQLSASIFYRYALRKNNEFTDFEGRSRYFVNLAHQAKFNKIRLQNRLRYQQQYRDNDEKNELQSSFLRYKLESTYKINKKISPFLATEFFYKIQTKRIDQLRLSTGIKYRINKNNGLEFGVFKDYSTLGNGLFNIEMGYKFDF
jgi:predicted porin